MTYRSDVDIDSTDEYGRTPLMYAAMRGKTALLRQLITQRADIHRQDPNSLTPLIFAARDGHTDTVKTLLDAKANPNPYTRYGFSPLIAAAQNGHTATVAALLDRFADTGHKNIHGRTALDEALLYNQLETVEVLRPAQEGAHHIDGEPELLTEPPPEGVATLRQRFPGPQT